MRTKLVVGLLVLGLAVSGLGVFGVIGSAAVNHHAGHSAEAVNTVTWTLAPAIRLTIANPNVDFGTISGAYVHKANANTLTVESNINWSISVTVAGAASDHLRIRLWWRAASHHRWADGATGGGNRTLRVDYHFHNLLQLAPGAHTVTVTFTATPR